MTALPALLLALALAFASAPSQAAAAPSRAPAVKPKRPPVSAAARAPAPARDVSRMTPRERRCYGRINQPAASVLLNRTIAPRAICVQSCEAKLIAPRRESGRIAALTLYTGRACRLPPGYKERPATQLARAKPQPSPQRKR